MNMKTNKWNFIDYLIMAILAVYFVLTVIFKTTGYFGIISFIGFCALFVAIGIVSPVNDYLEKGILKSRTVILFTSVRAMIVVTLIISGYEIVFSKNYNLKYTYWIAFISLNLIIMIYLFQSLVHDYKKRKSDNKRHNKLYIIGAAVLVLLLPSFQGYNLIQSFIHPKRLIVLDNLKVPEKILIYKYEKNDESKKSLNFSPISEISSPQDIKRITKELESIKVANISSTDLVNYNRMKYNNYPYYLMMFQYADANGAFTKLENGYIEDIVVTTNGNIVIEEPNKKEGPILIRKYYYEIYPISLSVETIDMIFRYLK